ncbi:uncharacterized protein LOC108716581 isoform X2 [Xenopus laevis]|uniref:Uncharacterized protein LOC108716581 isoform X2 n=1 Tax=Xenopus laevis TaxID=8355 RepID=A0A8J1KPA9_XENLA|nr:uncharacterized protein LOC108716581 isoform X2 [Xenopus laevis]
MNNCDLEKLSVPGVKLEPTFRADITTYRATVPSCITQIKVDALTSDTGASYTLLGSGGSKLITLKDGVNTVTVEVTAEDGTVKKYVLEVTKISADQALLHGIKLPEDLQLVPPFASDVYEYACTIPDSQSCICINPYAQDSEMKVTVNGSNDIKPVALALGDTLIEVQVTSANGTKSQIYLIIVTRKQLPCCVTFPEAKDQMTYECPVSLTAFYRPISIKGSDPSHTLSSPYMDLLTQKSKRNPFDDTPFSENWRIPEYELDMKMSSASVSCIYYYRGCTAIMKLSEFGHHARICSFKPLIVLDAKTVTESEWYKKEESGTTKIELPIKHIIQERNWEKRLQGYNDSQLDILCSQAEEQIRLYKQRLPKPGDVLHYKDGMSPLDALHQAAIAYASAIKLQPKNPEYHFHLGMVLEEHFHASEIYGLKQKAKEDTPEYCNAKATGKDEEIQAICKLHGFSGRPSLEQQLKALDLEYHQLKEQGQSSRADYIQNLYAWKSKQAGKFVQSVVDEDNPLAQAFLKYQDALLLSPDNWQYQFHVGRHLLMQRRNRDALILLQNALALRPASAITRCYAALALLEQDDGPGSRIKESINYLHQGMEKMITDLFTAQESPNLLHAENPLSLLHVQPLRGFLRLGRLLKETPVQPAACVMSSNQILHLVADWAAKAICQCSHRGEVSQDLEWILLESSFSLLQFLSQESPDKEAWIRKRCHGMTALLKFSCIPPCKELLDMQEKVCQIGAIASPCSSFSLYLLGVAQLARYDNNPCSAEAQLALQDAVLSFKASINLENMPTKGPPPAELTSQKWWQGYKSAIEEKAQRVMPQVCDKGKQAAPATVCTEGAPKGRGVAPKSRGPISASKPLQTAKKAATMLPGGSHPKAGSVSTSRGRGTSGFSSNKTAVTPKPKPPLNPKSCVKAVKEEPQQLPATEDTTVPESKPVEETPDVPATMNVSSYLHRLGLARALARTKETTSDASALYQQVIRMAPEVHDAYIELAELLLSTDPLAAVDVYCQYPQKPEQEQSFDDAFIPGEIVRLLIKCETYDDPRLPINMISYGKIMGIGKERAETLTSVAADLILSVCMRYFGFDGSY